MRRSDVDFMNDFFAPIVSAFVPAGRPRPFFAPSGNDCPPCAVHSDIRETDDSFILEMNLPGYKKEDLRAEWKDGVLTVSAEKTEEKEEKQENGKFLCRERFTGSFRRSFLLGDQADEAQALASFADGVLTITVPKKKEEEPKSTGITIQ